MMMPVIKTVDRERESPSAAVEVTTPVGGSGRNLSEGEGKEEEDDDDDALPSSVQWSKFVRSSSPNTKKCAFV